MIELTLARTKELLAEAVAEKGADYVYTDPRGNTPNEDGGLSCHYVHGDQPGCIVGHVLHKAGVSLRLLSQEEGNDAEGALKNLEREGTISYDFNAALLLNDAQVEQDKGKPWGEAVQFALGELERSA